MNNTQTQKQHKWLVGLGWWNVYFLIKLALFGKDIIDFHSLENLAFAAYLLLPISNRFINLVRNIAAFPLAIWLAHYDSFLPPLGRLFAQIGQLMDFEFSYLVELMGRFFNMQAVLALLVLVFAYYFLNRIIRVSVFVILAMIYIAIPKPAPQAPVQQVVAAQPQPGTNTNPAPAASEAGPVNDQVLNQAKETFFTNEASRSVTYPDSIANSQPFDVLFISVCSVAWDDIEISGLMDHPLFKEFDIMFDKFGGGTSYSGPALVRLLRASCGQEQHTDLFSPAPSEDCYLFDNLAKLGFGQYLMLNHNGSFDGFLDLLKNDGHVHPDMMSQEGLTPYESAFDGSHIYRDLDVLNRWWDTRQKDSQERVVGLYNTISLHDGNNIIANGKVPGLPGYKARLKNLLDDVYSFFQELKKSDRNIVVVLVPEHGAGMRGDKMQIPGMREIPSSTIAHTPVGLKVFGKGIQRTGDTFHVKPQSSYLALSTIVSRMLEQDIFSKDSFDPKSVAENLPETKMVAQNEGTTVMEYNGKPYVSLDGKTWEEYPQ
ncbi:MAG: cellulose biosynthesis protein BcsG [Vibrio sp.]